MMDSTAFLQSVSKNGYDTDWFIEPIEKYKCGLCLCVCRVPIEFSCGHMYCGVCFSRLEINTTCPECRETELGWQYSAFANKEIRGLKIKCPNDCDIQGLVIGKDEQSIIRHLDHECKQRKLMNCTNLGCEEKILPTDLIQHTTLKCQYRTIQCSMCQQSVLYINKTKHTNEDCEDRMINCTICHESMAFKNLKDHQNTFTGCKNFTECPNMDRSTLGHIIDIRKIEEHLLICEYGVIPCKYCSFQCIRKDMKEHESEFTKEHFDTLLKRVEKHEIEIQSLKRQKIQQEFESGEIVLIRHRVSNQWYKAAITDVIGNMIYYSYDKTKPPNVNPLNFEECKNDIKRPSLDGPFYIGEKVLVSTSYRTSDMECEVFLAAPDGAVIVDSIVPIPRLRMRIPSDEILARIKRQINSTSTSKKEDSLFN